MNRKTRDTVTLNKEFYFCLILFNNAFFFLVCDLPSLHLHKQEALA